MEKVLKFVVEKHDTTLFDAAKATLSLDAAKAEATKDGNRDILYFVCMRHYSEMQGKKHSVFRQVLSATNLNFFLALN